MKKEENKKYKVFSGKNLLKCSDCACDNPTCNDGSYFCANCGIWRVLVALILLIAMYKVGFIVGHDMANAEQVDNNAMQGVYIMKRHMKEGMINGMNTMMNDKTAVGKTPGYTDSNGCKVTDAAIWSKMLMKCSKLYEDAVLLENIDGNSLGASYLLISSDKGKMELYFAGSKSGIILDNIPSVSESGWVSSDSKYNISKSSSGKYILNVSGRVTQTQR